MIHVMLVHDFFNTENIFGRKTYKLYQILMGYFEFGREDAFCQFGILFTKFVYVGCEITVFQHRPCCQIIFFPHNASDFIFLVWLLWKGEMCFQIFCRRIQDKFPNTYFHICKILSAYQVFPHLNRKVIPFQLYFTYIRDGINHFTKVFVFCGVADTVCFAYFITFHSIDDIFIPDKKRLATAIVYQIFLQLPVFRIGERLL